MAHHALIRWLITHVSRDWSCTDHVAIMHWSRGYHAMITWLIMQWSRSYHALVTWLIMLGAVGEGDDRGWDGWMASLTRWTWVWVNSGSWWWTRRPGVLWFMGSQRVGHDWATELNWRNVKLVQQLIHFSKLKYWATYMASVLFCGGYTDVLSRRRSYCLRSSSQEVISIVLQKMYYKTSQ